MVSLRSHLAGACLASILIRAWRCAALLLAVISLAGAGSAAAADNDALVKKWIEAQSGIRTWTAEFTQTRHLKALTEPLKASGRVWFAAPNRFRWEVGSPAQTIAVRQPDQMLVIYPRLKRAERYPLTGEQSGPWKDLLLLLEAGFPRDENDLKSRYHVEGQSVKEGVCEVTLLPKSAAARRMMPRLKIAFATNDFSLRATELHFADGSIMRNDFANPALNVAIDETLFEPKLPDDFKIVEPLRQ